MVVAIPGAGGASLAQPVRLSPASRNTNAAIFQAHGMFHVLAGAMATTSHEIAWPDRAQPSHLYHR